MKIDWIAYGVDYAIDVRKSSQPNDETVYLYIDSGLAGSRIAIPIKQAEEVMRAFAAELKVSA
jgi:hypothetical protein